MTSLEYQKQKLINSVARDLQFNGYDYQESILKMQSIKMFSSWDEWELYHRPIDLNEIECILDDIKV